MERRINVALTLSSLIYDDITKAGLEIIDLKIVKIFSGTTHGAVLVDDKDKVFYIVFRGTEDAKDALTDIEVIQKSTTIHSYDVKIHSGFLKAYELVRDQIDVIPFGTYELVICGHSLGGAIATICGMSLVALNTRTVITFGSPRVGDKKFIDAFTAEVKTSYRFVHLNDIVPMFPNVNYKHVKTEYHLDDIGEVISNYNFLYRLIYWIKGKCKLVSIKDHYMINYQKAVGNWNKTFNS